MLVIAGSRKEKEENLEEKEKKSQPILFFLWLHRRDAAVYLLCTSTSRA
jgi:hypothetical protein